MGGNAHVHWQVRPQWQCDGLEIITGTTFVAGCRRLWLRDSNGFWWGRYWDDCDCYLRVDNQTSGHNVISNGVMRPTLYPQSSRFPVDQPPLFAIITWIPFLFSSISVHLLFHLHPSSFTLNGFLLFLSNSPLSFAPSLSFLLFCCSSSPSLPVSQPLGQEINDVREALAVFGFLLSKLNCFSLLVFFLFGLGSHGSWCCSVITQNI